MTTTLLSRSFFELDYIYNLHYEKFADGSIKCIEDDIPFDLPQGWAWTRLGNISEAIQYGLSNSAEDDGTHRLLRITDIQDGKVNWDRVPFTHTDDPDKYLLHPDDIVFARTGATVGKSFLISELPYPSVYASYLIRIRLLGDILPQYVYRFFNSQCYWEQITDKSVGVGQPNCNGTSLKNLFIPLPSKVEQHRIIPTVDELLSYVDAINVEKEELQSIINSAKSKILDLAIRGKLVPQDPSDEPASVLLERIRAEKEALIKAGKIKRDKKESIIFKGEDNSYYEKIGEEIRNIDDELPFDLPIGWCWDRIGNCCIVNPRNKVEDDTKVSFIPMPLICDGYDNKHTAEEKIWKDVKTGFTHFQENDVGIAKITPCFENRKSAIFRGLINNIGAGTTELHIVRTIPNSILPEYILWIAKTTAFIENGINAFSGAVGQKRIGKEFVENYLIPVPPYNEQKRIIKKIALLYLQIEGVEDSLS